MARISTAASSQKINFGYHAGLDSLAALTIGGWVFFPAAEDFSYIVGNVDATGNNGFSVQRSGGGFSANTNWLISARNTGVQIGYTTDNAVALNTWYWVVMVYDGSLSGDANRLKLYVDGVQKTLTFFGTIPAAIGASADDVCFFNNEAGGEFYPSVAVEDFKLFNVALTPNELIALSRGGMVRREALTLWPVLWGLHDPEIDLNGSGATGTLTNAPTRGGGPPRTLYSVKRAHRDPTEPPAGQPTMRRWQGIPGMNYQGRTPWR